MDKRPDIGAAYSHPVVRYERGSIEACSLGESQFDVAFSVATFEHVLNIVDGYREMVRLTRLGGTVFVLSAPLWNSRRGHHFDCLNPFPWIHLRYTAGELARFGRERNLVHNGMPLQDVADWLYTSDYFNRLSASCYVEACRDLPVTRLLRNELWMDGEEELTSAIREELAGKGYTTDELLATSHKLVGVK